jgi:hypothetical protein
MQPDGHGFSILPVLLSLAQQDGNGKALYQGKNCSTLRADHIKLSLYLP